MNVSDFRLTAPSTTPSSETTTLAYYLPNPCHDGQHVCSANCQYGFILGPGNCQYCMCAAKTTPSLITTTGNVGGGGLFGKIKNFIAHNKFIPPYYFHIASLYANYYKESIFPQSVICIFFPLISCNISVWSDNTSL